MLVSNYRGSTKYSVIIITSDLIHNDLKNVNNMSYCNTFVWITFLCNYMRPVIRPRQSYFTTILHNWLSISSLLITLFMKWSNHNSGKWVESEVLTYFHSSFSPIFSPYGGALTLQVPFSNPVGLSLTLT